jgi:hypothetical protein
MIANDICAKVHYILVMKAEINSLGHGAETPDHGIDRLEAF